MTLYLRRFQILFLLGLAVSSYLLFHHIAINHGYQTGESFCSIGAAFDCDSVARSKFSEIFGVPVASYGLLYFAVCFLVSVRLKPSTQAEQSRDSNLLLGLATIGLLPSLAFFFISKIYIGTFCLVCCLIYLITALLFLLAVRSPYRTGSFAHDLTAGLKNAVGLILPSASAEPLGISAGATWTSLVLSGTVIWFLPSLLITFYFEPELQSRFDVKTTTPYVTTWRSNKETKVTAIGGGLGERDFSLGSEDAPLQIIEFSDFECPYCKKAAEQLKPFVMENLDKVRFVFKNYPLDHACNMQIREPKHMFACKAAAMARCAGAQGEDLFWKMHDALMQLKWMDSATMDQLPMDLPGLDTQRFDSCAEGAEVMNRVRQDIDAGVMAEVKGTPSIFVNGRLLQAPAPLLPGILRHILHEVEKSQAAKHRNAG